MKFFYFLRATFISLEFAIILCILASLKLLGSEADAIATKLSINDELLKYTILLPAAFFAWSVNEVRGLLTSNDTDNKTLINWPNYWKLKQHAIIALLFSIIFTTLAATPWLSESGIKTGSGLIIFTFSCLGGAIVAASIYFARISIHELMVRE